MPPPSHRVHAALVLAVGHALAAEQGQKVTPYAGGIGVDPRQFVDAAARHGTVPLLAEQSDAIGLPDDVGAMLKQASLAKTRQALRLAHWTQRFADDLAAARIPALFIKGVPLSLLCTGRANARQTLDLDILVRERDMPATHRLLTEKGLKCPMTVFPGDSAAWRHARWVTREMPYQRPDLTIDLHWRIPIQHRLLPSVDAVIHRASQVEIAHSPVRTLCPADALLATCYHSYLDGYASLKYLVDLRRLLPLVDGLPGDTSPTARRMVADTLQFAREVLPDWPEDCESNLGLGSLRGDPTYAWRRWLTSAGKTRIERSPRSVSDYAGAYEFFVHYADGRLSPTAQFASTMMIAWESVPPNTGFRGFGIGVRRKMFKASDRLAGPGDRTVEPPVGQPPSSGSP